MVIGAPVVNNVEHKVFLHGWNLPDVNIGLGGNGDPHLGPRSGAACVGFALGHIEKEG